MPSIRFVLVCLAIAILAFALAKEDAGTSYRVLDHIFQHDMFAGAPEPKEQYRPSSPRAVAKPVERQASPRRVSPLLKKKVAARDRWRCRICKAMVDHTFEIDHITPLSRGGSNSESNLRLLCCLCHGRVTAEMHLIHSPTHHVDGRKVKD